MKKIYAFLCTLLVAAFCCLFAACSDKKEGDKKDGDTAVTPVVITANASDFAYEDKTLKDYMDYLVGKNELTYVISDGMVTSINGKANAGNSYWMLYTSDNENANEAWGTYVDGDKTYGSAVLGAEALAIKQNCVYVWVYQTFSL